MLRDGTESGSQLGGAEEFREERFSLRSTSAIRSSWRATRSSKRRIWTVHPQQHRDHDLTALVIDRLSLNALHALQIRRRETMPPNPLNAYGFSLLRLAAR